MLALLSKLNLGTIRIALLKLAYSAVNALYETSKREP